MRGFTASPSNTRDRFWAEGHATWIRPNMLFVVSENTRQKQKTNREGHKRETLSLLANKGCPFT